MKTFYDYITIAGFAGLIVLFLHRSLSEEKINDPMWHYMVASVGCAVGNYLGNQGYAIPAVFVIVATAIFIVHVIKPFPKFPGL
jgi:hypothetical protein